MKQSVLDIVICPDCGGGDLILDAINVVDLEVIDGRVLCQGCTRWFRVEGGVLDLLPADLRREHLYIEFSRRYGFYYIAGSLKGESQKLEQITFFAADAGIYDADITDSPYYHVLDATVVLPWVESNIESGMRILEVGCGTGRQCKLLASRSDDVVSLDISEEMLRVAFKNLSNEGLTGAVNLIAADAERLPFKAQTFDGGLIVGTLHHVSSPVEAIAQLSYSLRAGAPFFAYDPHKSLVRFMFDWLMKHWKLYDEEASEEPLFTESEMLAWTEQANITAITRISTYLPPHFFYLLPYSTNNSVLRLTDRLFDWVPGLRRCGGLLITMGNVRVR